MERLTKRIDGKAAYRECNGPCGTCDGAMCFDIEPMVDRLAAYEETGMTPKQVRLISNVLQEVGETYNCWFDYVVNCVLENSHLKELSQADKDGLLVVLPSKDYCWRIRGDIFLDIIRANCRAAHEEAEAALKKREEVDA